MPHRIRIVAQPCVPPRLTSRISPGSTSASFAAKYRGTLGEDLSSETECQGKDDADEEDGADGDAGFFTGFVGGGRGFLRGGVCGVRSEECEHRTGVDWRCLAVIFFTFFGCVLFDV